MANLLPAEMDPGTICGQSQAFLSEANVLSFFQGVGSSLTFSRKQQNFTKKTQGLKIIMFLCKVNYLQNISLGLCPGCLLRQ